MVLDLQRISADLVHNTGHKRRDYDYANIVAIAIIMVYLGRYLAK